MKNLLKEVEKEAIVLFSVLSQIDDMVNYRLFESIEKTSETNLTFCNPESSKIFNILLVDFLSVPKQDSDFARKYGLNAHNEQGNGARMRSYLTFLLNICENPQLGKNIEELKFAVNRFIDWLDQKAIIENMWLGEISVEANILASRFDILKISGNIGKHTLSRLDRDIDKIIKIFENSNIPITKIQAYRSLEEIYEWFFKNFFYYHSSSIAEFLNNIRLAIHYYLTQEFARAHQRMDDGITYGITYTYIYPQDCEHELAKVMYWNLMNKIRGGRNFPKFTVSSSFKDQY